MAEAETKEADDLSNERHIRVLSISLFKRKCIKKMEGIENN